MVVRKQFSDEFRRQAVDLLEGTPGATVAGISKDLGVSVATLYQWLHKYGSGERAKPIVVPVEMKNETMAQKVVRLEAENALLRADKAKVESEKRILHAAAKYFAGETNW